MCCCGVIGVQYFLVVLLNDSSFHVVHACIANFDGVLIKDFAVLMAGGEVFGNKSEEPFCKHVLPPLSHPLPPHI